jgi:transcription antitermination factor NusG
VQNPNGRKVAEQLTNMGIECYCPLITRCQSKEEGSRSFLIHVFVQLADTDRSLVFQSLGAVRYLFWLGKPAIVRDEEIGTIKKWLETPDEYDVAVDAIQIGDKITLDSGPFSAQEAIVRE